MTINDIDTSRLPAKKEEVKTPEPVAAPVVQELETTAVGDILGLNKEEMGKYHDKIDTLLEWAKGKTDDHSLENLKWTIRELGFSIGSPPLGQKQINWLAEYAFLETESRKINNRLKQFKNGNN